MHELSIAMSIVEVASEEAQRQGGARVEVSVDWNKAPAVQMMLKDIKPV